MRPQPSVVREFVWEPIADLGPSVVFAFGASWFPLLPDLGVTVSTILGRGGRDYGSVASSRSVLLGRSAAGSLVIAEKHSCSAGPPSAEETNRMREHVERWS
jgi:hypothetical protein